MTETRAVTVTYDNNTGFVPTFLVPQLKGKNVVSMEGPVTSKVLSKESLMSTYPNIKTLQGFSTRVNFVSIDGLRGDPSVNT